MSRVHLQPHFGASMVSYLTACKVSMVGTRTQTMRLLLKCFGALLLLLLLLSVQAVDARGKRCTPNDDPDICRTPKQLITSKGYPAEEYRVVTKDGYILKVQRIPYGRRGRGNGPRPVVFLQHGLLSSSVDWLVNMPHQSLGFILADAGYDVWMGNIRGNTYSSHIWYSRKSKKFWDFTFEDMAAIDLPAMINFVLRKTSQSKLFYVGHSQGTMILFALLSTKPQYKEKIILFCALAPVATLTYTTSPVRLFAPFANDLEKFFETIGHYDFLQTSPFMKHLAETTCKNRGTQAICVDTLFVITGLTKRNLNMTRLPVIINHFPAGTSVKNMAHFGQIIYEKHFQRFDYGPRKNRRYYGQETPPEYDVSRVGAPVALFFSLDDWFCNMKDVGWLMKRLPNIVLKYQVRDPKFTHLDFTLAVTARSQVYEPMIRFMERYRQKRPKADYDDNDIN